MRLIARKYGSHALVGGAEPLGEKHSQTPGTRTPDSASYSVSARPKGTCKAW